MRLECEETQCCEKDTIFLILCLGGRKVTRVRMQHIKTHTNPTFHSHFSFSVLKLTGNTELNLYSFLLLSSSTKTWRSNEGGKSIKLEAGPCSPCPLLELLTHTCTLTLPQCITPVLISESGDASECDTPLQTGLVPSLPPRLAFHRLDPPKPLRHSGTQRSLRALPAVFVIFILLIVCARRGGALSQTLSCVFTVAGYILNKRWTCSKAKPSNDCPQVHHVPTVTSSS